MTPDAPAFPARYQDPSLVRRGRSTSLYRAHDSLLQRPVALKVLAGSLPDPELLAARLSKEAATLARLDHPGIVRVYDVLPEPGPTLVEEYVPGRSLADLVPGAPVDPSRVARLVASLLDALVHAHECGVVHRALEPGGVVLTEDDVPRILDFGYATWTEACVASLGGPVLARFDYAAPEVIRGEEAGPAADLYSLGVIAAELLTGALPHARAKPLHRSVPATLPGVPEGLAALILGWLAPEAGRRPGGVEAAATLSRAGRARKGAALEAEAAWMALARQVLHPLKNRLALARRYPDDPGRVEALMARPAVREETRAGVAEVISAAPPLLAGLRGAPGRELPALRALGAALEEPGVTVGPSLLEPAFREVKHLVDRAVVAAERHLVGVRDWARAWVDAAPWPVTLAVDGDSAMSVLVADGVALREDLTEVAATLATNAVEAGASAVSLRVSADEGAVTLEFRDDGGGLPPGDPEHLFAAGGSIGKEAGSGLGLADARRRAEVHGGTLRAVPRAAGASMVLTLPRSQAPGGMS